MVVQNSSIGVRVFSGWITMFKSLICWFLRAKVHPSVQKIHHLCEVKLCWLFWIPVIVGMLVCKLLRIIASPLLGVLYRYIWHMYIYMYMYIYICVAYMIYHYWVAIYLDIWHLLAYIGVYVHIPAYMIFRYPQSTHQHLVQSDWTVSRVPASYSSAQSGPQGGGRLDIDDINPRRFDHHF